MLNRVVMGNFRSKIEVKSSKSFAEGIFYLCQSILFFTFEQCVNVSKIFLPSFKVVQRFWRDFFSKRVTDDDDRRKTFFFASCSEYSSLIYRLVTMEYRTSDRGSACISSESALRVLSAAVVRPANTLIFHCASWASNLCAWLCHRHPTFLSSEGAVVRTNILSPDLSCSRQVHCRLAVEKFESSLNIGNRVHELPFPSRQTVMHSVIMSCQFTRNDSLTWLVESERR